MEQAAQTAKEEERRQLRPYRRFVRIVFFLALTILCGLILRGIIRSLDRMPSSTGVRPSGPVDTRALKACAEDLGRLERKLRTSASELLAREPSTPAVTWQAFVQPLEMERVDIVVRCRLDEPSSDPVVGDLKKAASAIEDLARSYGLLYDRHREEGRPRSEEARKALDRAVEALKSRE